MRGMKKWLPFKSLKGQFEMLDEMKEEQTKEEKPELSLDEIEDINRVLIVLQRNDSVKVRYFQNGHIVSKDLNYLRCDPIERKAVFREITLDFDNLLGIERLTKNAEIV